MSDDAQGPPPPTASPTLVSTCLCRTNQIPLNVTLPRTTHLCHCTTCRTVHGTLFSMSTDIDRLPSNLPSTLSKWTNPSNNAEFYSCSICGTQLLLVYYYELNGQQHVGNAAATGPLSLAPEYLASEEGKGKKLSDVLSVDFHCLITDTIDGGAAVWSGDWTREDLAHFHGKWEEPPSSEERIKAMQDKHTYPEDEKELEGWCKCEKSRVRLVRDDVNQKFRTTFCACDSCRLASAVDIAPLSRIPRKNAFFIQNGEAKEWPNDWDDAAKAAFPEYTVYASSPGVFWGSCKSCGASVWHHRAKDDDGEVVQVWTGIMGADTSKGILHLGWFDWDVDGEGEDEAVEFMSDARAAGRSEIVTEGFCRKYGKWARELKGSK